MKLFDEIKIGNLTLKNRVVLAPMGTTTDQTFGFNMRDVNYYGERAKGGVGLVMTGAVVCTDEFEPAPCQLLKTTKHVYYLQQVAERVHIHGAKFAIQLSPGIGRINWIDPNTPPYSSSPCPNYYFKEQICRELPTESVKKIVKAMGVSAKLAKGAGVDCIELHGYGGYLIDQFISAKWNKRTDEYGGSFENRQRFLFEIIEEVRKTCGPDYPIGIKMTLESIADDERPLEEGLAIAKRLAEIPVDFIHFGRGSYSCRWRMVSSVYQPPGFDLESCAKIREVIGEVPLMVHGKLNHHEVAEEALQKGTADLIAIGHGLIADAHWANKVRTGKLDEINPCIGCGECHARSMKGHTRPCAVNPMSMRENEFELTPAAEKKRILVIGAGPAGLKAAATAAERGFEVALWDKNIYMGGSMAAAGAPRFKKDVKSQVDYLIRQVNKRDIDVRLGKTATVEDVKKYNPDFVVVATGANPIVVPVPGCDKPHVTTSSPVLLKQREVGQKVVVVGGGEVGCELAVELFMEGKQVTVVEMLDDVMLTSDTFVANHQNLRHLVDTSEVKIMAGTKLLEVLDSGVIVDVSGVRQTIPCDSVVFAVGFRANQDLYKEIKAAGYEAVNIGDNINPGMIFEAIHQGYHTMRVYE